MNYLELLNKEEQRDLLTNVLGAQMVKAVYSNSPNEFSKICSFRIKKLSDEFVINFALDHIRTDFIANGLNAEIRGVMSTLEDMKDMVPDLANSFFSKSVPLYFKLSQTDATDDDIQYVVSEVKKYITEHDPKQAAKEEKSDAEESEGTDGTDVTALMPESNERVKALQASEEKLREELQTANAEIARLNGTISTHEEELKNLKARIAYDDTEIVDEGDSSYAHCSICEVLPKDYKNTILLRRYADISKGKIERFVPIDDLPNYGENTDAIFYRDGPSEPGTMGIWDWRCVPNKNSPDKLFIESQYNSEISPIGVVVDRDCTNQKELIAKIISGVKLPWTQRVLLAYFIGKGKFAGFLCSAADFEKTGTYYKLKESVLTLPLYQFESKDIIKLGDEVTYYKTIRIGIPVEEVQLRDMMSIVKAVILKRITWPFFKERGLNKSDFKAYRDLTEMIPTDDILGDIEAACKCTQEQASGLLKNYMNFAAKYMQGETVEDDILLSVIQANEELQNRCKDLVEEDWKQEQAEKISAAEAELNNLSEQTESEKFKLEQAKQSCADVAAKQKEIETQIAQKTALADEVEQKVAERIAAAQNNAAEFIATMAFMPQNQDNSSANNTAPAPVISVEPDMPKAEFEAGESPEADEIEELGIWTGMLYEIGRSMEDAGVSTDYASKLAAFLYSAYLNKFSVLLVGPNALEIADAFSAAVIGQKSGRLICAGEYSKNAVETAKYDGNEVISILNPFEPKWITHLPEICTDYSQFYFVVYPYSEDLAIEPKSLYNYVLPIFTEYFVDHSAEKKVAYSIQAPKFKEFPQQPSEKLFSKYLAGIKESPLLRSRVFRIMTDLRTMCGSGLDDILFLFHLLPYAAATMQLDRLAEVIHAQTNEIHVSAQLWKNIGELHEEFK